MDKKVLTVYIIGGAVALLAIIFTVVLVIGMGNKPVNICTTLLTNDMAGPLLEGYSGVNSNKTSSYIKNKGVKEAYLELLNNSSDVILVSDIDSDTIRLLKANGVEVEKAVIARDALVFVNNVKNPVENLTSKDIYGIYSGKNENWVDFNGNDGEIIAYPPVTGSEESYMMEKFMGRNSIIKPKYRLQDQSLNGLMTAVSEFLDTRRRSIFYTTFHNMKETQYDNLRMIKLDDIEVSKESIKNEYYPATMDIYAVIRSDVPSDSQTRRFVEYIKSKDGQAIIEQCGYVNLIK